MTTEPAVVMAAAVAMSLYQDNVPTTRRAAKLYDHFDGNCAELDELLYLVDSPYWATEMALPTAYVYLQHALERYAEEAASRVSAEGVV